MQSNWQHPHLPQQYFQFYTRKFPPRQTWMVKSSELHCWVHSQFHHWRKKIKLCMCIWITILWLAFTQSRLQYSKAGCLGSTVNQVKVFRLCSQNVSSYKMTLGPLHSYLNTGVGCPGSFILSPAPSSLMILSHDTIAVLGNKHLVEFSASSRVA